MKPTQAINAVTATMLKATVPDFSVGDTVRVSVKVVEGSRERIQVFEGVVMRRRSGGINANFTVRRIASHGIGVERTFLLNSPRIDKIEVIRRGVVRRAQLYYLRGLTGKAARIKERRYRPGAEGKAAAAAAARALATPVEALGEDTDAEEYEEYEDAEEMDDVEEYDEADEAEGVEGTEEAEDVEDTEAENVEAGDEEESEQKKA